MRTTSNSIKKIQGWAMLFWIILLQACTIQGDNLTLGDLPQPDFQVEEIGPGRVRLTNTTGMPSISSWTVLSTGQQIEGDVVELNLIFEGSYDVKLDVVAQGGMGSVTKSVSVSEDDPTACSDETLLGFLASCSQKTWRLNPEAGAFKVGPAPDNGEWWSSGVGDIAVRSCEFNDEFTFSFNAAGTFAYDNKGDFFADGYLGNRTSGCEPASNLSGNQALWNSGNFQFSAIENAGVRRQGQLRLIGRGAHIGVKKAHNGGETEGGPVGESILYDVLERNSNVGGMGYDILKIGIRVSPADPAGNGTWWTFTLRSFN